MAQYAIVENGVVVNVVEWDGSTKWTPPSGQVVAIPAGMTGGIGDAYANGKFTSPAPSSPPAPTLAQQAQAALGAGLAITSSSTSALDGTYAVASGVPYGREDIQTEAQFVSTFGEFTNGKTTLDWPLIDGKTTVTFPTTADFLNVAKAAGQFYAATMAVARAGTGTLPSATATIP